MAAETIALTFVEKIVEKFVDCLVAPIGRQFGYLFSYDDNIANLSKKIEDLDDKRGAMQQSIDAALRNSETIKNDVTRWQGRVEDKKVQAKQILEDNDKVGKGCLNRWCVNLKSRYSLSKKAVKKARDLDQLLEEGQFEDVAHPKLPLGIVPDDRNISRVIGTASASAAIAQQLPGTATTSGGFESSVSTMRDIMESLEDDSIRILRICGMGGVGKTTMAKKVEKRVRDEHLFQEIAKAEFTQQPDVGRIQGYLAESVGLKLDEDDLSARAVRICERLNDQNKKILLILDNVWSREDLERVGIPLDEEKIHCKILLTSRSEDVCAELRIQKIFRIGVLSDQEAQILFENSVGSASCARMGQTAEDIVKECGGLPLAIKTIGKALAGRSKDTWDDVLGQLKKSMLQGKYAAVYNSLEVSYEFLDSAETKDFFLLCCLFPEGFDVPIEELMRYGMGLRLFKKIGNVQEARTRAYSHIETLLNSNLLLVSDLEERVKMHDLVRDFALSTASKGLYMVKHGHGSSGLTEWIMEDEDACQRYTSISLQCGEMDELPDGLDCPKLRLLKLVSSRRLPKFQEEFYKGMGALNVLAFSGMFVPLAPSSVQLLANLRTLFINDIWEPCDISTIANLENLEVLSLAGSSFKNFPRETRMFSRLRLLDLTRTQIFDYFPPGVLSCLIHLEELYVRNSIGFYTSAEEGKARIAEIKSLTKLVVLDIDIEYGPINIPFENLERFKISVGSNPLQYDPYNKGYKPELNPWHYTYRFQNTLKLIVDKSILVQDGYKALLRRTEILDLQVKGSETFLKESEKGDCSNLKILSLASCNELVYLINTRQIDQKNVFPYLHSLYLYDLTNLEAIYNAEQSKESFSGIEEVELQESLQYSLVGPTRHASFGGLRVLDVRQCNKLEYIFSRSIARSLVLLERLQIVECKMLRAIFSKERGDEDEKAAVGRIEFPQLKYLELDKLPKFTSLFTEGTNLASDQQVSASARDPLFNQKGPHTAGGFRNLTSIVVKSCNSLRQLFTPSMAILFGELQNLELRSCEALQALVAAEGDDEECKVKGILFPQLNRLCLASLPNLSTLMPKTCTFSWLSLKKLTLVACGGESDLFTNMSGLQKDTSGQKIALTSLEEMKISQMKLNMLWNNPFPARCSFNLKRLAVAFSDTPTTISHLIQGFDHLEELNLTRCDSLEIAFELEELSVLGEHKVVILPQLRKLNISSMFSMTQVWKIGPLGNFQCFQNLTELFMSNCDSLRYLLSPFIAKYLVKLRRIEIRSCAMMAEVFSNKDQVEDQDNLADILFLPELDDVRLESLQSLLCIRPGGFDFDRLSLEATGTGTSTESTRDREVVGSSALISSPTSNEKFPGPKSFSAALEIFEGITQRQCPSWSLCYPKTLLVLCCHRMSHVISSSDIVVGLKKLDSLHIKECDSVVEIFEVDGTSNIDEERALTVPNLRELYLTSLRKLTYIWRSKLCRVLDFPNLQRVDISGCKSMRYLFCSSTVTSLVQLKYIKVRRCEMMEVIVKEFEDEVQVPGKGKSDRTTKLVLPRLKIIELEELPNIRGICLGLIDFDLPSLEYMEIKKCPKMKIFTTGYSSTPNLEEVWINSSEYSLEGDINTVLNHVQAEKTESEDEDQDEGEGEGEDEDEDERTSVTSRSDDLLFLYNFWVNQNEGEGEDKDEDEDEDERTSVTSSSDYLLFLSNLFVNQNEDEDEGKGGGGGEGEGEG